MAMDNRIVVASRTDALHFFLVSNVNHIDPVTGTTPTVWLSKNGAAFAAPLGMITEIGYGWYEVGGDPRDVDTVGPLILHAVAPGADPIDDLYEVIPTPNGGYLVQFARNHPLVFLMIRTGDHMSGATGLTPTVRLAPLGQPWAPPAATGGVLLGGYGLTPFDTDYRFWEAPTPVEALFEIGFGWYGVNLLPADVAVAGPLLLHAEATGADPSDARFEILATPAASTELIGAIKTYVQTQPLLDEILGGFYANFAPEDVPTPYVVVLEAQQGVALRTSTVQRNNHRVVFRVYDSTAGRAGYFALLVKSAFTNVGFTFTGGVAAPLVWISSNPGLGGYGSSITRQTNQYAYMRARGGKYSVFVDVEFQTRLTLDF